MAITRKAVAILLIALVMTLVPLQATLAESGIPDSGHRYFDVEGEYRAYYPSEADAQYWITYPSVGINEIAPGAGNEYRLTIGNLMDYPLNFYIEINPFTLSGEFGQLPDEWVEIIQDPGEVIAAGVYEVAEVDKDWISITKESSEEAGDEGEVLPASTVTVLAGEQETFWIHVDIPRKSQYKDENYQCAVNVMEAGMSDGLSSVLYVHTADNLSSGGTNVAWVFAVLVISICLVGAIVYGFSRWKWPNEPKDKNESESRTEDKEVFSTGLSPADWKTE
jgi:hypothetical protein